MLSVANRVQKKTTTLTGCWLRAIHTTRECARIRANVRAYVAIEPIESNDDVHIIVAPLRAAVSVIGLLIDYYAGINSCCSTETR